MRFESCKTSTRKTEEKNLYTDLPHAESRMQIDQMSQGSQVSLQLSVLLTTAKVLLVMVTVIPTDRQTLSCFVIELVSLDMLLLQILIDISLSQYKRARRTMWQQTTARSTYLSRPCMRWEIKKEHLMSIVNLPPLLKTIYTVQTCQCLDFCWNHFLQVFPSDIDFAEGSPEEASTDIEATQVEIIFLGKSSTKISFGCPPIFCLFFSFFGTFLYLNFMIVNIWNVVF